MDISKCTDKKQFNINVLGTTGIILLFCCGLFLGVFIGFLMGNDIGWNIGRNKGVVSTLVNYKDRELEQIGLKEITEVEEIIDDFDSKLTADTF